MVLPLIAAAAATAAANWYNGEQNRKQNQAILDANRDALNGVPLPELNESDYANPAVANGIDPANLYNDRYQSSGDYRPDQGEFVREQDPRLVALSEQGKFGRDAQMEALRKFQGNIKAGYDPEFAAKLDQAQRASSQTAQSRMASILQDAQRRGQLGSNAMLSAQMQASSDSLNRGSLESQQAAVEAYKNQMQQQRDAASMGGQLANSDQNLQSQNANILNSFNERTSRAYQNYLSQANEQANQAKLRNLNNQQNINNSNVDLGNQQRTAQFNAARGERDYQNKLIGERQGVRQDNFNNQMSRVTGQMNQNNAQIGMNNQNAQARAGMIQGAGEGFAGYYNTQEAADARNAAEDRADRRANFQQTGAWDMPEKNPQYGLNDDEQKRNNGTMYG